MAHTQQFAVFVPVNATIPIAQIVLRGSALMGTSTAGELVTVDFEGNVYGASKIRTFADRARRTILRSELRQVAWFDSDGGITLLDDDKAQKALGDWLDVEKVDPKELHFSK